MKVLSLTLCAVILSSCATLSSLDTVERIIVFGDSNVDTKNLAKLFGSVDPRENVWKGRNSNGPLVTEYLAEQLGAKLITYAVSGATTGETNIVSVLAPQFTAAAKTGMLSQISGSKQRGLKLGGRDLVVLWAGSNDIFRANRNNKDELLHRINTATDNLRAAVDQVANLGARRIIVATRSPRPDLTSNDNLNGLDLNRAIRSTVASIADSRDIDLILFDAYAVIAAMVQNPANYGFKYVYDLCVKNPDCSAEKYEQGLNTANTYINWDAAHKTTKVHSLLALELSEVLRD